MTVPLSPQHHDCPPTPRPRRFCPQPRSHTAFPPRHSRVNRTLLPCPTSHDCTSLSRRFFPVDLDRSTYRTRRAHLAHLDYPAPLASLLRRVIRVLLVSTAPPVSHRCRIASRSFRIAPLLSRVVSLSRHVSLLSSSSPPSSVSLLRRIAPVSHSSPSSPLHATVLSIMADIYLRRGPYRERVNPDDCDYARVPAWVKIVLDGPKGSLSVRPYGIWHSPHVSCLTSPLVAHSHWWPRPPRPRPLRALGAGHTRAYRHSTRRHG